MANASYLKKFDPIQEATKYSYGIRTGVRTAADFTITLGFKPIAIHVVNLTDRIEATHYVDPSPVPTGTDTYGLDVGANAKSLLIIDDGTHTYEAAGIALTSDGLGFTVTVATKSLEVNDKDTFWEAWG
jgi:hypothetical protein